MTQDANKSYEPEEILDPDEAEARFAVGDYERLIEALIFSADAPVPLGQIQALLPEEMEAETLLAELQARTAERGVVLVRRGSGWVFRTAPDLAPLLNIATEVPQKLSRAAMETLAVIAYHQPVTRAEIEAVRGVACSKGTLDLLMEIGWIKPGRRRRTPGRPVTWITTAAFIDHFGLEDLDDLPGIEELKAAGLLDTRPALDHISGEKDEPELPLSATDAAEAEAEREALEEAEDEGRHNLT